jgi:hypothetical protein
LDGYGGSLNIEVHGALVATAPSELVQAALEHEVANVDLSTIYFVQPAGLVALVSQLAYIAEQGVELSVIPPTDPNVATYMSRARFPQFLEEIGASHSFTSVRENDQGHRMIEIASFDSSKAVYDLAASLQSFAAVWSEDTAAQLFIAMCEAGENVPLHARTSRGFLMAQHFPRRSVLRFALGDPGIGYRASLADKGATSHAEGLELAATPGVSSSNQPNRGNGLSEVRNGLNSVGGTLSLYSGNSSLTFSPRGSSRGAFIGNLRGALVAGELPTV